LVKPHKTRIGNIPGPPLHFPDGNFLDLYLDHPSIAHGVHYFAEKYNYPPLMRIFITCCFRTLMEFDIIEEFWVACIPVIVACSPEANCEVLGSPQIFGRGPLVAKIEKSWGTVLPAIEVSFLICCYGTLMFICSGRNVEKTQASIEPIVQDREPEIFCK
jgi:hypothetical protein